MTYKVTIHGWIGNWATWFVHQIKLQTIPQSMEVYIDLSSSKHKDTSSGWRSNTWHNDKLPDHRLIVTPTILLLKQLKNYRLKSFFIQWKQSVLSCIFYYPDIWFYVMVIWLWLLDKNTIFGCKSTHAFVPSQKFIHPHCQLRILPKHNFVLGIQLP